MRLEDKVSVLKGAGPKRVSQLEKLNVTTIEDMVNFLPRRYEDRRRVYSIMEAPFEEDVLIQAKVVDRQFGGSPYSKNRILKILVEDNTGLVELVFFNGKYIANLFQIGMEYVFFGKITLNRNKRQMVHPQFFKKGSKEDIRGLFPVYPLTEGISQSLMRNWQMECRNAIEQVGEWLPNWIKEKYELCDLDFALRNIHFPREKEDLILSKYRLVFEELLVLQTGLFYIKNGNTNVDASMAFSKDVDVTEFEKSFPFKLTEGQKRAFDEIERDLESTKVMNRLVQGDVGSGKTAIAQMALYKAVKSGFQGAMMAPTELLAKQHLATLKREFEPFNIKVKLLSGSTKSKEKKEILEELEKGEIDILVGTHAVIEPNVRFKNLGLVITDEQHRFGVNQRESFAAKGKNPNILVMTATPIPRTLAVILYGDLDISIIDTLPEGRKPIKTHLRYEESRQKIYAFVESEIKKGRQAYVVAPLIEPSELMEVRSATELYDELSSKFSNLSVGLVHGNMKQKDKDAIMEAFATGNIDILVSTVVIEVGIDVGNATVMVIENCERFGLAQLHQLRGRVGRSHHQSHCILISGSNSKIATQRNEIMCKTENGFVIAEEDLKLRGPGEMFGTRQHGIPELNITDLVKHVKIAEVVKDVAEKIIEKDPELIDESNKRLKERLKKMFGEGISLKL